MRVRRGITLIELVCWIAALTAMTFVSTLIAREVAQERGSYLLGAFAGSTIVVFAIFVVGGAIGNARRARRRRREDPGSLPDKGEMGVGE